MTGDNIEIITIIGIIIITIIIKMAVNYQLLLNNLVHGFRGSKPVRLLIIQTFVRNEENSQVSRPSRWGPGKKGGKQQIGNIVKAQNSFNFLV